MSNYDSEIQTRVRGINRKYTEHQKRIGRGMTNEQTEDQIVDLSNLEDIQPSADTGRKITGGSRQIGCGHSGGGKKNKKVKISTRRKAGKSGGSLHDPSFNPVPEDYLSKNQLDNMTAQDRRNFKDHPDWWNVYKPVKQVISPSVYAKLTPTEKANLKTHPDWLYGDEPTLSNASMDPALNAQVWALNENNKAQSQRDNRNFNRDVQQRKQEANDLAQQRKQEADDLAQANEPSDWDTLFSIGKTVLPMVLGLGKPKKTKKAIKGKGRTEDIEADIARRKQLAQDKWKQDDKNALEQMTSKEQQEYKSFIKDNNLNSTYAGAGIKKTKPTNPWITHVKTYALKNKINYRDALKDPKCKQSYKK